MNVSDENSKEKLIIEIDEDLKELIPGYLQNKHKEIESLTAALSSGDFETILIIGHSMKGNGSGYGFIRISELGKVIEEAAKTKSARIISESIAQLNSYLNQIEIVYIEV